MALPLMEEIAAETPAPLPGHRRAPRPPPGPARDRRGERGGGRVLAPPGRGLRRLPLRDRHPQGQGADLEEGVLRGRLRLARRARDGREPEGTDRGASQPELRPRRAPAAGASAPGSRREAGRQHALGQQGARTAPPAPAGSRGSPAPRRTGASGGAPPAPPSRPPGPRPCSPRLWATAMTAVTTEASSGSVVAPRTNERSILSASTGSRRRWASEEKPAPKPSIARWTPTERSARSVSTARSRSCIA